MLHEPSGKLHTALIGVMMLLAGCGDASPQNASFVAPVFTEPCRDFECAGRGACVSGESEGGPYCECETGYAGPHCEVCDAGFHRDANQRCVPDKRCADQIPNPCGGHGECKDAQGVIECECADGYEGPRCALCAPGHQADGAGDCLLKVLANGQPATLPAACAETTCSGHGQCSELDGVVECKCYPGYVGPSCDRCDGGYQRPTGIDRCIPAAECDAGECGGCVLFDGGDGFPSHPDTCTSGDELSLDDVTLWSLGGDGQTWLCSQSSRYDFSTEHVALEAGTQHAAELTFREPVSALSFDLVAWEDAPLELTGDGRVVGMLRAQRYVQASQSIALDPPVRVFGLRSLDEFAHTFALDNVIYALDPTLCD